MCNCVHMLVTYSYFIVAMQCYNCHFEPRLGSEVVRINPRCFLAGYRKMPLNQALSVLSLSLGFF